MRNSDFITGKVPITKEEVRAVSISSLELENAEKFMDIGAGTGSVSIEAAYRYPKLSVTAVERNDAAIELIEKNSEKFKTENLEIIKGYAPYETDEKYDAVFIGGTGNRLEEIIEWTHDILNENGRVCANFIVLGTFYRALEIFRESGFEDIQVRQISVSNLEKIGTGEYFKPQNPVFVITCRKKGD